MKLFIWRHNRRFHSYSMMEEPCVHRDMYTDALAVVMAETEEQALELLAREEKGWFIEELRQLRPQVVELDKPGVVLTYVCGV